MSQKRSEIIASRFFPADLPTESGGIKLDHVLRQDSALYFIRQNCINVTSEHPIVKVQDLYYGTNGGLPVFKKQCGLEGLSAGQHVCFIEIETHWITKRVIKYMVMNVLPYDDYSWYFDLVHEEKIEVKKDKDEY